MSSGVVHMSTWRAERLVHGGAVLEADDDEHAREGAHRLLRRATNDLFHAVSACVVEDLRQHRTFLVRDAHEEAAQPLRVGGQRFSKAVHRNAVVAPEVSLLEPVAAEARARRLRRRGLALVRRAVAGAVAGAGATARAGARAFGSTLLRGHAPCSRSVCRPGGASGVLARVCRPGGASGVLARVCRLYAPTLGPVPPEHHVVCVGDSVEGAVLPEHGARRAVMGPATL
eukprot:10508625-Alexandrium_andersonii.AAC.1